MGVLSVFVWVVFVTCGLVCCLIVCMFCRSVCYLR